MNAKTSASRRHPIPYEGDFRPAGPVVLDSVVIRAASPAVQPPAIAAPSIILHHLLCRMDGPNANSLTALGAPSSVLEGGGFDSSSTFTDALLSHPPHPLADKPLIVIT